MRKDNQMKLCKYCIILFLPLAVFLMVLQAYAFNVNYYMNRFEEYNISEITQIKENDLESITVNLIDYLKSDRENLEMVSMINGRVQDVFGEREIKHMEDVKVLFDKGILLRNISVMFSLAALIYLILIKKYNIVFAAILKSGILSLSLTTLFLILMKVDFYKYFTYFHEIFFTNDLWLLDPKTDVLIQMLPLEFFISISTRVVIWFLAIMFSATGLSYFGTKLIKTKINAKFQD